MPMDTPFDANRRLSKPYAVQKILHLNFPNQQ
jgi:hypothetical protein